MDDNPRCHATGRQPKTCDQHNHNPPSRCPNCRIARRRQLRARSAKGWGTRRTTQRAAIEAKREEQEQEFRRHGWFS